MCRFSIIRNEKKFSRATPDVSPNVQHLEAFNVEDMKFLETVTDEQFGFPCEYPLVAAQQDADAWKMPVAPFDAPLPPFSPTIESLIGDVDFMDDDCDLMLEEFLKDEDFSIPAPPAAMVHLAPVPQPVAQTAPCGSSLLSTMLMQHQQNVVPPSQELAEIMDGALAIKQMQAQIDASKKILESHLARRPPVMPAPPVIAHVAQECPKDDNETPVERVKMKRRESAQRSRARKSAFIRTLELENQALKEENMKLRIAMAAVGKRPAASPSVSETSNSSMSGSKYVPPFMGMYGMDMLACAPQPDMYMFNRQINA